VVPVRALSRKSGYARDDKGEGNLSMESGFWTEGIFHHLGWAVGPRTPPEGLLSPRVEPLRLILLQKRAGTRRSESPTRKVTEPFPGGGDIAG
jgi:hypothetical protein